MWIETIENEMDIRVESLVAAVHNHRNEFQIKLDKFKEKIKKYTF